MKVGFRVCTNIRFYHSGSLEPFVINKELTETWEEGSPEFMLLVERFQDEIGHGREGFEKEYDKKMLELAAAEAKKSLADSVLQVGNVFKESILHGGTAVADLFGCIINLSAFCAMETNPIEVQVYKK